MPITDGEKNRRRALLKTHYEVENDHDMNGIMATFAPDGEMLYNRISFADPQSIRDAHDLIGFTGTDGAFIDVRNCIDVEHFTEDEIIVEGRLCGKHVGEFQGFEATGRNVELPFIAFYHFDKTDKLMDEIRLHLSEGKGSKEIIGLGYAPGTVYRLQREFRKAQAKENAVPMQTEQESPVHGAEDQSLDPEILQTDDLHNQEQLAELRAEVEQIAELRTEVEQLANAQAAMGELREAHDRLSNQMQQLCWLSA